VYPASVYDMALHLNLVASHKIAMIRVYSVGCPTKGISVRWSKSTSRPLPGAQEVTP